MVRLCIGGPPLQGQCRCERRLCGWACSSKVGHVAPKPEPLALKVEPVALKVEPIALKFELVALKVEPVALKLEPVALKVERVALKVELIAQWKATTITKKLQKP